MKMFWYHFFQTIKVLCFWGLLYLLFLMVGFGVSFNDLWMEATTGNICIKIVSFFLLGSPIIYIIIAIVQFVFDRREGQFVFDHIGSSLLPNFWPIYKVFSRESENKVYFIIQAVLWWGMTAFCVYSISSVAENRILQKVLSFSSQEIWIRIGIFVGVCFILYGIAYLFLKITMKRLRDTLDKYGG